MKVKDFDSEAESMIRKVMKMSLEEKRFDTYLIGVSKLLFHAAGSASGGADSIKLCTDYLRFVKSHADEALVQSYSVANAIQKITHSMSHVSDIYFQFPQIGDEQVAALFITHKDVADKYDYQFMYWKKKLELDIFNKNKPEVEQDLKKYVQSIAPDVCYICSYRRVQEAYILLGRPEKAIEVRDNIVAKRIPKEYEIDLEICQHSTIYDQNRDLLEYAVQFPSLEFFHKYASETHDSLPVSEASCSIDLVVSAYLGQFENAEKEIEVIREFENNQDFPYEKMLTSLFILAYLWGMQRCGLCTIPLSFEKAVFDGADTEECSVSLAIEYFSAIADDIGRKFEKSRKAFNYGELKQTLYSLSQGQ